MQLSFDALLLVSFGGPEGMADVRPFLENVLRGRQVPEARKEEVAHHYEQFGGVSPINNQNRKLIKALQTEFQRSSINLPIYWGNRNWHPLLTDTIQKMADDGIKKALAFVTSAYASYSGCRQYLENIDTACRSVGSAAPKIEKLRLYFNHPLFIEANASRLQDALSSIPNTRRSSSHVVFTAHSIPTSMAAQCSYEEQLKEAAELVATKLHVDSWSLAFQSRSGPASQPWLEPDINDCVRQLKAKNMTDVIILPIGFVSDHMEVIYDLDYETKNLCKELGINLVRALTVGTHPLFIGMIKSLVLERFDNQPSLSIGKLLCPANYCSADCCPPPRPSANSHIKQISSG